MATKNSTAASPLVQRRFGFLDILAYGAGDFGCNMSYALKGTLSLFWTQFMGISPVTMASLLLLVQVCDAVYDPLIGAMVDADKRQYKRNKFLQYVWVGSVGLLVAGALCFVPWTSAPYVVKCILFVAGYILWDAFYTIANVPYGSMLSLISNDATERAKLSTGRSVGAMIGGMASQMVLPMLIYDENNEILGTRIFFIALVLGVLGFIAFQFMLKNTVVRVDTALRLKEDTQKFNLLIAAKNFLRNRAAVGATLAPAGMFLGMYGATTASQIMFQSYFQNARISGALSMVSYMGMFLFIPFVTPIVKKFGKKEAVTAGACVCVAAYVLMLALPITPDGKGLAMFVVCQLINAVGGGIGQCMMWSLMADAMDYEEWRFGTRNEGTTYALHSFFRKLAQGVGPSLGLVLAAALGYDQTLGARQTAATALNMRYLTAAMYLVSALIQLVAYGLVFNLDKKTLAQMEAGLGKRHKNMKAGIPETADSGD